MLPITYTDCLPTRLTLGKPRQQLCLFNPLLLLAAVLLLTACSNVPANVAALSQQQSQSQPSISKQAITQSLQQAGLDPTQVSLYIEPLDTDQLETEQLDTGTGGSAKAIRFNASQPLLAASVMKLYTSAAVLDLLGPGWQGQTSLAIIDAPDKNGRLSSPLYIKGTADVDLNAAELFNLLAQLRAQGVRQLAGGVVFDRSRWQDSHQQTTDPWQQPFDESPRRRYNHRPDLLAIDQQMLTLQLDSKPGVVRLTPVPAVRDLMIRHNLTQTNQPCSNLNTDLWQVEERLNSLGGIDLYISGEVPASCQLSLPRAWVSRQHWAALLVRHYWLMLDGEFAPAGAQAGHVGTRLTDWFQTGITPDSARVIASHQARPLSQLVQQMNKISDNSLSRTLFLELGASMPGPSSLTGSNAALATAQTTPSGASTVKSMSDADTISQARQRLTDWLSHHQISQQGLVFESGAGISRQEHTTTTSLASLIRFASQQPWYPEWLSSLPRAGVDGTLQSRLSQVADKARLKTGTLRNAAALAGVVWDAKQRPYIFVGIVNGEPDADFLSRARGWLDSQVAQLAGHTSQQQ